MQSQSQRIIEKILNSELRDQSSIEQNEQNDRKREDYVQIDSEGFVQMVIQLDSNKSATIKIRIQDDPFILAKAFCFQYSIDPRVINTLASNIRNVKNMEFNNNKNKASMLDKQNMSSFINASSSFNQSFDRAPIGSRTKNLHKSSMTKNDTTMISNDCSRQTVFDRLYQNSRKKQQFKPDILQSIRKKKKMSNSILQVSATEDPCIIIYQKNTKAYKSSLLKRQKLFQQRQQKMTKQCTFKPQVNQISQVIAKRLPQSYRSQQNRERDMKRIQKHIQQKQKKQLEECTFQPKILHKSRSRSKSAERYKVLYEDSRARRMKRKTSQQLIETSRKKSAPKINRISQCIVGNRTFFQRLKSQEAKRRYKKQKIEQQLKIQKDRRPSTGRGPKNRARNILIGQHLYNQAKNKSKQTDVKEHPKNKLTCYKSEQIYQNTKKTAFQYIFALLDSNQDGLISNTKIQLGRLSGQIIKIIAPLLIQLEEMEAELDQFQFVEALNRLFNSLSLPQKQKILNVFRSMDQNSPGLPSFKPTLNQKSLLWAKQSRPQKMSLYDLWKETEVEKQQKLQQIRAVKVLESLNQCTFHPRLFR